MLILTMLFLAHFNNLNLNLDIFLGLTTFSYPPDTKNIEAVMILFIFPTNVTWVLQLMDEGVIKCLKKYKKHTSKWYFNQFGRKQNSQNEF